MCYSSYRIYSRLSPVVQDNYIEIDGISINRVSPTMRRIQSNEWPLGMLIFGLIRYPNEKSNTFGLHFEFARNTLSGQPRAIDASQWGRVDMSGAAASPIAGGKHRRKKFEKLEAPEEEKRVACLWQQIVSLSFTS